MYESERNIQMEISWEKIHWGIYFIDLCKVMTNTIIAITTNQPDKPSEMLSIFIVGNDVDWETRLEGISLSYNDVPHCTKA